MVSMPDNRYIIEQLILSSWSIILLTLYLRQLHYNKITRRIVFEKQSQYKTLGKTAIILHYGGTATSILLVIRSVDPIPVFGLYPPELIDAISHTTSAILLITIYETISCLISKLFIYITITTTQSINTTLLIRTIHLLTILVSTTTTLVSSLITKRTIYSDGIFIVYVLISQWIMFLLYILTYTTYLRYYEVVKNSLRYNISVTIHKFLKKLNQIKYAGLLCLIPLTLYEIYLLFTNINTDISEPDKDNYKFGEAIFMYAHCIIASLILYFSYINPSYSTNKPGLSEVSAGVIQMDSFSKEKQISSKSASTTDEESELTPELQPPANSPVNSITSSPNTNLRSLSPSLSSRNLSLSSTPPPPPSYPPSLSISLSDESEFKSVVNTPSQHSRPDNLEVYDNPTTPHNTPSQSLDYSSTSNATTSPRSNGYISSTSGTPKTVRFAPNPTYDYPSNTSTNLTSPLALSKIRSTYLDTNSSNSSTTSSPANSAVNTLTEEDLNYSLVAKRSGDSITITIER